MLFAAPPKSAPAPAPKRVLPLIGSRAAASAAAKSKKEEQERSAQEKKEKEEVNKAPFGSPLCPKLEDVPLLEPLVCKRIAPERLNDIVFHDDCILISTQEGVIMTWCRPGRRQPHDPRADALLQRAGVGNLPAHRGGPRLRLHPSA